jgi:hypothetical protein
MTEPLVTQAHLEGLLRRLRALEARVGRTEVRERGDYGFGSFAPTLVGAGTPGTFTYGVGNLVEWTRIGNRLFFNGRVVISATTVAPTLALTIRIWPYAGVADANMAIAGIGAVEWSAINLPANYWSVAIQFANGSANANLVRSGTNNVQAAVVGADLGAGGVYDVRVGGSYRVA